MKRLSSCSKLGAFLLASLLAGCSATQEKPADTSADQKSGTASETVVIDPQAQTEHDLALDAFQSGNLEASAKMLEALIKHFPDYQTPYVTLGLVLKKLERYEEAETNYHYALKLNKHYAEVYNQLAVMYREQGKLDQALQTYEQGLSIAPNHAGLNLNLGILYDLYLRQPQKALLHYQTYYDEVPDTDIPVKLWISDLQQRLN